MPMRRPMGLLCLMPLRLCRLKALPLYGLGVSSGASFVLKLPRFFKASELGWFPLPPFRGWMILCVAGGWAAFSLVLQQPCLQAWQPLATTTAARSQQLSSPSPETPGLLPVSPSRQLALPLSLSGHSISFSPPLPSGLCSSAASCLRHWASTPALGPSAKWMDVSAFACAVCWFARDGLLLTGMNRRCGVFPQLRPPHAPAAPCAALLTPSPHPALPCRADFPPTLFVSMVKDPKQSAKIGADWSILTEEGSPVGIIRVGGFQQCG